MSDYSELFNLAEGGESAAELVSAADARVEGFTACFNVRGPTDGPI